MLIKSDYQQKVLTQGITWTNQSKGTQFQGLQGSITALGGEVTITLQTLDAQAVCSGQLVHPTAAAAQLYISQATQDKNPFTALYFLQPIAFHLEHYRLDADSNPLLLGLIPAVGPKSTNAGDGTTFLVSDNDNSIIKPQDIIVAGVNAYQVNYCINSLINANPIVN